MTDFTTIKLQPPPPEKPPSRLRAYLQLLRLPSVFTAMADVLMGAFVAAWSTAAAADAGSAFVVPGSATATLDRPDIVALLVAASSCLYLAGMVLNDYFDRGQDAVERPSRPIPSGRVSAAAALRLGVALLLAGVSMAGTASVLYSAWRPALIAVGIVGAVLLYDAVLKRTLLGPLAMGACRGLNALLGMSLVAGPWLKFHYLIAGGLAVYVAGITWVGRTEAKQSQRLGLLAGLVLMWLGMALIAAFPFTAETRLEGQSQMWLLFWGLLGMQMGWRVARAIIDPSPAPVQAAVRQGILSLVVFDAAVTFVVAGMWPGVGVLALLVPTVVLAQWLYVT
ncbi:MAG: UbiA family prenyltransferase [Planctomycetia bacterium]|nr:UbiA family prenyltransferase [Planctomycetia bacterium]